MDRKQEDMIRAEMMAEQAVARMNRRMRWPMAEEARRSLVNSLMRSGAPEQFLFSPEPYRPAPPLWSLGGLIARIWLFIREMRGDPSTRPTERPATLASMHYAVQRSGAPGMLIIIGVVFLLSLPPVYITRPFDTYLQAVRDALHRRPTNNILTMVSKDDRRTGQLGTWTRQHDAELVDRLRELGVKRIVFNEIMSLPTNAKDDAALARAFDRARGLVWLPALPASEARISNPQEIVPYEPFRVRTQPMHFLIRKGLLTNVTRFEGTRTIRNLPYPSMPAILAGRDGYSEDVFPDYSFDVLTIKPVAAIDILQRKVDPKAFAGRTIFISHVYELGDARVNIPLQGSVSPGFTAVIAAETLAAGPAVRLGLAIPMAVALAFGIGCVLTVQRRKRALFVAGGMVAVVAMGLLLDRIGVHVEFAPALLAMIILGCREMMRSKGIEAMMTNAITGLPNLAHLDQISGRNKNTIVAVKIERYQEFIANRPFAEQRVLLNSIVARINIVAPGCIVHQGDEGLFVFLVPPKSDIDIAHLPELLLALFTQDVVGLNSLQRVGVSVGANSDTAQNFEIRLALAIERATVSAYITPYAVK